MELELFKELPIMGIVRGIAEKDIGPLIDTVIGAGLGTIEITMNTPGAPSLIEKAVQVSRGRIAVGAGTVLSKDDMDAALEAGATFIVMPVLVNEVMQECLAANIPVFPGAFTPQEVFDAWKAGASMVKLFPAGFLGPAYIRELKGPFDGIKIMAVGGVRAGNVNDLFSSGADAVAFGASIFQKELIAKGDFAAVGRLVGELVQKVRGAVKNSA